MYEHNFSEGNRVKLDELYNFDSCGYCSCLQADQDAIEKQDKLFTNAETWLNSLGIETRTSYNNLLPTYNLFIEIGNWLERNTISEVTDE